MFEFKHPLQIKRPNKTTHIILDVKTHRGFFRCHLWITSEHNIPVWRTSNPTIHVIITRYISHRLVPNRPLTNASFKSLLPAIACQEFLISIKYTLSHLFLCLDTWSWSVLTAIVSILYKNVYNVNSIEYNLYCMLWYGILLF